MKTLLALLLLLPNLTWGNESFDDYFNETYNLAKEINTKDLKYKQLEKSCNRIEYLLKEKQIYVTILKMDDSEILPAFLLTAYTSFPFNSCQQSSILFHKNINKIYPRIPLYKLTRNKKDLFKDTGDINNFLTGF